MSNIVLDSIPKKKKEKEEKKDVLKQQDSGGLCILNCILCNILALIVETFNELQQIVKSFFKNFIYEKKKMTVLQMLSII